MNINRYDPHNLPLYGPISCRGTNNRKESPSPSRGSTSEEEKKNAPFVAAVNHARRRLSRPLPGRLGSQTR